MNTPASMETSSCVAVYREITGPKKRMLACMVPFLAISILISLSVGSMEMSWGTLFSAVMKKVLPGHFAVDAFHYITVWDLRLPCIAMGMLVGVALGISGAGMQSILNNPLASPYTLGISSAAGFGAALAILLGAGAAGGWTPFAIAGSAFLFSCLAFSCIYFIARLKGSSAGTMLFAGIALMYLFSALLSLIQYFAPEEVLQQIVFWMFGSLAGSDWPRVFVVFVLVIAAGTVLAMNSWKLTALKFGEDVSKGMGIDTAKVRNTAMVCTSLLTAAAVCFTGVIGFIGLVAPHIARMLLGEDARFLFAGSAMIGAILLVTADTIGRSVFAPYLLPVGIVTSTIGAPFFIFLIVRKRGEFK